MRFVVGGSRRLLSSAAASSNNNKLVYGLGSAVVDRFHSVRALPKLGAKAYFAGGQVVDAVVVGGVTLNHLAWASLLGVPTGILGLQGDDESGRMIRAALDEHGIARHGVVVSPKYASSESLIFTVEGGERSIIMATAATSQVDSEIVKRHFQPVVTGSQAMSMVTTEISQVPLSAVWEMLALARLHGVPSCIDVDVPPSVAENEAKLGTADDVCEVVAMADVVKPTLEAAVEILSRADKANGPVSESDPLSTIARRLVNVFGCTLAAVTDGQRGAGLASKVHAVDVGCFQLANKPIDATGAGDAFFGGLVAGLHHFGFPRDIAGLMKLGQIGAALGAANIQVRGALPHRPSTVRILQAMPLPEDVMRLIVVERSAAGKGVQRSSSTSAEPSARDLISNTVEESFAEDAAALATQANKLHLHISSYVDVCEALRITAGQGRVFTTGLGKSGHVAHRLAASLSSVGISTEYVHAAEWVHGDLGKLSNTRNIVIAFSNSGKTSEIVDILPLLKQRNTIIVAVTSGADSPLAQAADHVLLTHVEKRSEPLGLVPSVSVVMQEAVSNAILRAVGPISHADFLRNHPGGAIGKAKQQK